VLADLERAKYIILGAKSQFYKDKIIVISYCCNGEKQYLKESKVAKITYWKDCKDTTSAQAFLGVCGYY